MTPKWLLEEHNHMSETQEQDNVDLEKERQKLMEELKQSWEEDK